MSTDLDAVILPPAPNPANADPTATPAVERPQDRIFDRVSRFAARIVMKTFYGLEVKGAENAEILRQNGRFIITSNHVSFGQDIFAIVAALPVMPTFAMDVWQYNRLRRIPLVGWFLSRAKILPVDLNSPMTIKTMANLVKAGKPVMIFPEGRLTRTGRLMVVEPGAVAIASAADAQILPIALNGFERLKSAPNLSHLIRQKRFPKLRLAINPPEKLQEPDESVLEAQVAEAHAAGQRRARTNTFRRENLRTQLTQIMQKAIVSAENTDRTLVQALRDAAKTYGKDSEILVDALGEKWSYRTLLRQSYLTGRILRGQTKKGDAVGLLLPNAARHASAIFGLMMEGRVPAELNPTMNREALLSTLGTAQIKTLLTARAVTGKIKGLDDILKRAETEQGVKVIYAEDLRSPKGIRAKLAGLYALGASWLAVRTPLFRPRHKVDAKKDRAFIMFTSGSEGLPKGVVYSHGNILTNCAQVNAVMDFNPTDVTMSALPLFHSFGLTGGLFLPLFSGVKTALFPSPTSYAIVPRFAYHQDATVVFGTDAFLNGWGEKALPGHLNRLRLILGGAAKIQDKTRALYIEKFGRTILEGYGATEAAPVIAVNTVIDNKPGTVGRLLPEIESRLEPFGDGPDKFRLAIKGDNIMLGYLKPDQPGVLQPPPDGWYDTGDIVSIDNEGRIKIVDRAKEIVKIGGEMIAPAAVENMVGACWPESKFCVIGAPDPEKGEKLVLFTDDDRITVESLLAYARDHGVKPISIPREIVRIAKVPMLASGKADRMGVKKMWRDMAASMTAAAPADGAATLPAPVAHGQQAAQSGKGTQEVPVKPPLIAPTTDTPTP